MNLLFRKLFLSVFIIVFSFAQSNDSLQIKLQKKIDELQKTYNFPGATFALITSDNKAIHLATGLNSKENNVKMSPNNLMFGGSTGKIFVAPVILQLVKENKLILDDLAIKYLEKEEWFKKLPNYDKFTIRNLLNHTSGIPEYIIKETFGKDIVQNPDKIWKPEELLSYIAGKTPVNAPGEGWSYADANYIILGIIIEKLCNNTFYAEVEKRILSPLKLKLTVPSTCRIIKGLSQGYSGDNPYLSAPSLILTENKCFINPQFEWTGGGFATNSLDLAIWAKYLWRGDFLSEELNKEMKSVVGFQTGKPDKMGYGLGLMKFPTQKFGDLYTHGGIMFGFLSEVFYLEKYDASIAIQINTDPFSGFFNSSLQQIVIRDLIPFISDNLQQVK